MKRLIYILTMLLMMSSVVMAQSDRKLVREGNKLYHSQKYSQADNAYRKALGKNAGNPQAIYNLGCALMSQGNDSAAIVQFNNAAKLEHNKSRRAKSYHNIGVILQKKQDYGEAIEAYKNALRNNPNDNDTRYNLVACKRQQKQQQQNRKNSSDNDKNDKNNKNKEKKQNKENKDKNKRDKERDEEEQQPKDRMDKQNAEQLLNAAMQKEKSTHERLKKAMQQPSRRKTNKNW